MTELLALKAGRAFRRDGTNFVDPSPTKGAIILSKGEDELLHFIWKNRTTNEIEEVVIESISSEYHSERPLKDLILFPSDASFLKVSPSSSSRTYVLRFSSSNQRHFVSKRGLLHVLF
jgi:26S proteasome regulatory subunit N13